MMDAGWLDQSANPGTKEHMFELDQLHSTPMMLFLGA